MSLAFLAFAWLLGIAAAAFTGAGPAAALAALGLLGAVSFARSPQPSTLVLIVAGGVLIFTAGWRYDATRPGPAPVARFNDGPAVRLRAVVGDEPQERARYRVYRLDVRETFQRGHWKPDSGGVLVYAPLFPEYEYGDLLEVSGKLEAPPSFDGFDYRLYLFRRGVGSVMSYPGTTLLDTGQGNPLRAALSRVRSRLTGSISNILPEPEASLAAGTLLDAGSGLPPGLKDDMNATGTTHLVAVSGQNVSILAGLIVAALAWVIGRRPAAWTALVCIIAYGALVGAQPSVVRAVVMGSIYVASIIVGRQNTAWVALLIAAAGMTAWEPQLAHDVSFQLSVAATLGLVLMATTVREHVDAYTNRWPAVAGFRLKRPAVELATVTATAIAFTLPITTINFQRVSLSVPVANLFAVPAFVAVALTAALAAAAHLVLPASDIVTTSIAWPPAAYTITVVQMFARIPVVSVGLGGWGVWLAIPWYAALLGLTLRLDLLPLPPSAPPLANVPGVRRSIALPAAAAAVLALASVLVWLVATAPPSGRLSVTFLDVGQGDAILVRDAGGHRILVDGGPGGEAIEPALGRHLPFFDRRIDLVVLTHPQDDHMGGLISVLNDYRVGTVLVSPAESEADAYQTWLRALDASGVPQIEAAQGQRIGLADGAALTVLAPGPDMAGANPNDTSVVLKLTAGDVSFLLTGDLGEDGEYALIRSGADLGADVLKVGHHGSRTSTSPPFLNRVRPIVDVISVGAGNHFGHPTQDVLDRLSGGLILRTDQQGDVTVSTDGERMWVQTQRNGP